MNTGGRLQDFRLPGERSLLKEESQSCDAAGKQRKSELQSREDVEFTLSRQSRLKPAAEYLHPYTA